MDIEKLKQKILDLAIRGKLVPQDPNDEPSSVLIEKIKNEKNELIKQGKIKPTKDDSYIYRGSDNCYYENNAKIDFKTKLDFSSDIIWMKGKDFIYPMESKRPTGNEFKYIDIDAINNKTQMIDTPKIVLTSQAPSRASRKVYSTSTLFSMVRPYLRNIAYVGESYKDCIASTGFYVCTPMPFVNPKYLYLLLTSDFIVDSLNFFMKGDNSPSINGTNIENLYFPILPLAKQIKTVNLVEKILQKIEFIRVNNENLLNLLDSAKRLVLDEYFGENSSYKSYYENEYKLGDLLQYEQPGPFIVKSTKYNDKYVTPVLTPGKSFILGYTNESDGIYKVEGSKVIIFDDFTTASRLIDFDFKVKSSAMKILHTSNKELFDIDYLFYKLQTINIISDTHKRFWISEYSPLKVKIHTINEQKKIVEAINDAFTILNNMSKSI